LISLIVGDPQGILDQQFIPHPHLLNIIMLLIGFIITLNEDKAGYGTLENYHYFPIMKMPALLDLANLDDITTPRQVRQVF
jgi:hypothetical protein